VRRTDKCSLFLYRIMSTKFSPPFAMIFALLISLAVCSSAAIPLSGMLIYHDTNDKTQGKRWERALAVFLEFCQIGLSGGCIYAIAVALRSGSHVYWYDAVALCNLQLSIVNNVGSLPLHDRLC
jgi:hypothetical protein